MTYDLYDTEMMNNWTIMIYNKTYYLLHVGMLTQNEFWLKTSFDSGWPLSLQFLNSFLLSQTTNANKSDSLQVTLGDCFNNIHYRKIITK